MIKFEDRIRIVQFIRDFMEKSRQYRRPHVELARKARELYETWQTSTRSAINRANLKLPYGFIIIETQLPQLIDLFCKDEEVLLFEGKREEQYQNEDIVTDFHNYQLKDMKFFLKFPAYVKAMLLDGTAFAKIPYRYDEAKVIKRANVINS